MDIKYILDHMNNHHKKNIIDLCKKQGIENVNDAYIKNIDLKGLDIVYDGLNLRIDFPNEAKTPNDIKDIIIAMCKDSNVSNEDFEDVRKDMHEFMQSLDSICLATINKNNEVSCSYAPIIKSKFGNYIYISQVSEHFENIKSNPNNIEIMFLEDESKAKSVILRKRLRFKAEAKIMENRENFDEIFDEFEKKVGSGGGIKTIRNMKDFYLVKLEFKEGRFVRDFGGAYDILGDKISFAGDRGNPHKMK